MQRYSASLLRHDLQIQMMHKVKKIAHVTESQTIAPVESLMLLFNYIAILRLSLAILTSRVIICHKLTNQIVYGLKAYCHLQNILDLYSSNMRAIFLFHIFTMQNQQLQPVQNEWQARARDDAKLTSDQEVASCMTIFLCASCNFIDGFLMGFTHTMPYVYSSLPTTNTMTLFSLSMIPFAFKFVIAPFMETFTTVQYGKRKLYCVLGSAGISVMLFVSSFFTELEQAQTFALLLLIMQVFNLMLGVSIHALSVKQLKSVAYSSLILLLGSNIGFVLGATLILKLTSLEFAYSIGLEGPITNPQTVMITMAGFSFVLAVCLHFLMNQRVLDSERRGSLFSVGQILCYYRTFVNAQSRYCRVCLLFLLYEQGFSFFTSLFHYQQVKRGFSRDTLNNIQNIITVPSLLFSLLYPKITDYLGGRGNATLVASLVRLIFKLTLLIWFPTNPWILGTLMLGWHIASFWTYFLAMAIVNAFPTHSLSAMFIAMLVSMFTLGGSKTTQTWLSGKLGWELCSYVGLGYQLVLVIFMRSIFDWIYAGNIDLPPELTDQRMQQGNEELIEERDQDERQ